ncbi:hypothetical protein GOC74_02920 [Halomicrobium mukohataei]|uniref:Uncharacterized protein n=1 Tax=Halomicrobium mukohataei TaxID=57705 RepID=A0A847U8L1_9EURY|nr:hypothetical protein [Halomicrobium mukohataei]
MTAHRGAVDRENGYNNPYETGSTIVAIEHRCTPDRTTAVRSVCKPLQLLL